MKKARILIIENEFIVADDLSVGLEREGYEVVAKVSNADRALEKCLETHPDLVLMDIKLERENKGLEAARFIRAELGIPVVYLTDYPRQTLPLQKDFGPPNPCVTKPFREEELCAIIKAILTKSERNTE